MQMAETKPVLSGYYLIFFQVKNPKRAVGKLFECSYSILRLQIHGFFLKKS